MKKRLLLGCGIPVLAIAGLGWWYVRRLTSAPPPQARTAVVDVGDVDINVAETGTIEPLRKVEVKSKVGGRVAKLLVDEGSVVHNGQVVAEIDPTEINSQVEQSRAQWAAAQSRFEQSRRAVTYQVAQTRTGIEQYRQALRAAEAKVKSAEAENASQPAITDSEIGAAEATYKSAEQARDLLARSTHPLSVVQARTGADEAIEAATTAKRKLERQQKLMARGFVSAQAVDTARSELASAEAQRAQTLKRLELIEEQNRIELASADSRMAEAKANLARAKANRSTVAVRQQDLRSAQAALAEARAQYASALSGRNQDAMRRDDVNQARAQVVQLKNQLQEVEVKQHDTTLLAPIDGVVTQKYIEQGELVTSGVSTFSSGTPVLQVADLSRMIVKMSVNEVDVHRIRVGLPVDITIDGVKGVAFTGHVRKLAPSAISSEQANGQQQAQQTGVIRFAVEIAFDRPDSRLKPGMSAHSSIIIARRRKVLRVPVNCVTDVNGRSQVQVVTSTVVKGGSTNVSTPRTVTVGVRGDAFVEITSGLKAGERLQVTKYQGPPRKGLDMHVD